MTMAEGLSAPRPRKPVSGQPRLIPDSALVSGQDVNQPKKPKHFWEGTVPNVSPIDDKEGSHIRVRGYKISGETVIKDAKGRERELDPITKLSFEREDRHGTADSATTKEVDSQYGGEKPKFRR